MGKTTLLIKLIVLFILLGTTTNGQSQTEIWKKTTTDISKKEVSKSKISIDESIYELQKNTLHTVLEQLPAKKKIILSFPDTYNQFQEYRIQETQVMHPLLASKYKSIKTYTGKATDGSNKTIRFTYSKLTGIHGIISDQNQKKTSIQPVGKSKHRFYNAIQEQSLYNSFDCLTEELQKSNAAPKNKLGTKSFPKELKKYRLAVSVPGEYSQFYLDGTEKDDTERKTKVLASIVTTVNRINEIFRRDFGVVVELIPSTDEVIFLNSKTDPYYSWYSGGGNYANALKSTLNQNPNIGIAAYDIGHLFQVEDAKYGNAGSVGNVCLDEHKGKAYSVHRNPESEDMRLLVAHEMGHQFGAYHVSSKCRSGNGISEVEPGSGSTIMSYAGICAPNVQAEMDGYYNYVNIRDVQTYLNTMSCGETINTTNNAPVANAGNNYVIPVSTPFVLTGQATDIDGVDNHTYTWEQNDPERPSTSTSPKPNSATGPLFRSLPPANSPKRYFPALQHVIEGNLTPTWEVLPSVARTIDFAFTVRDNGVEGGQTDSDLMTVTVASGSEMFTVTSQNQPNIVWNQNEQQTISWNVGKTDLAPISVSHVNVLLSLDGGYTYPLVLANNIPNDGSETIIVPTTASTERARVMVQAVGNIFYAINSTNFKIQASEFTLHTSNSSLDICKGEEAIYTLKYQTFLDFDETVTFTAQNLPAGATASFIPATINGKQLAEQEVRARISNTTNVTVGSYDITLVGTATGGQKKEVKVTLNVYDATITPSTLTNPANVSFVYTLTPTLRWQNDSNVSSFEYQVATDANFINIIESNTVTLSEVTLQSLQHNTSYFWRVKKNNACQSGMYSPPFSFTTACSDPQNFIATEIGHNYADLNWDDNNNSSWELEYGTEGFAIGTGTIKTANTANYKLTGLLQLSKYDIYLRSKCTVGQTGSNIGPIQIKTLGDYCNGDRFYDSGGPNGNYSNREDEIIVLTPDNDTQRIRLDFQHVDIEPYYDDLAIYDGPDTNSRLITWVSGTRIPSSIISTHQSGKLTLHFISDENTTSAGWDAIVSCEPKPLCRFPDIVTFENTTSNSTTVNWSKQDTEESWELEYGLKGFTRGQGTTVIANTNSHTLQNLDSNTEYDIYVRAKCIGGGYSDPMPVSFTFRTLCGIVKAPFYESFPDNTIPDCWTDNGTPNWSVDYHYGGAAYSAGDHTPGGGTRYAWVYGNHTQPTNQPTSKSTLESPLIDVSGLEKPSIGFALFSEVFPEDRHSKIEVSFFDGNQWNVLLTKQESSQRWTEYYFDISGYTITDAIKLRFEVTRYQENGSYQGSGDILIDDVFVGIAPDYCGGDRFYDSGGPDFNYKDQEHRVTVLAPNDEQSRVRLIFDTFDIAACCSTIDIYDGPDTSAPHIGTYTDTAPPEIVSTHPSGKLTVLFVSSQYSVLKSGWDARVICEPKPIPVCQSPDAINFTEITSTSVNTSWDEHSGNTQWEILYTVSGDTSSQKTLVVNQHTAILKGLSPDTQYDVFIKSICNTVNGELKGPYSFKTAPKPDVLEPEPIKKGISYFPNPTTGKVFIESGDPIREIKVAHISGQTILSKTYNANDVTLSLDDLAQGIYFITVYSSTTKRIIKVLKR
ncbi:reprolysin-like metallopeptidase [Aquimarina sediminis]|uniref:reprolysin-like metallopeptidase n=1 Tax=Aquimarina sediminis TaxID=2070536 RepID=UPI0013E899E8|nr:fibronectin type III domain-containing protein [Aquimarina sediminis]